MTHFSFIDLFAGIGGFRLALESVGGNCLGFSEIAPDAINSYCENYKEGEDSNFGDITKLKELPPHDFLTAGVPCQSWSIAGKKLGFDDDRGQLWNDTIYLLNQSRPKAFIFENVKGLADPRNKNALDYILERIREAGYFSHVHLLNAFDYGVPQTRVRIYIIGFKDKEYWQKFSLPFPQPGQVRLSDVLDDVEKPQRVSTDLFGSVWSLSCNEKGFNDYFLFNDLRNGGTTIHSWDIQETTERQKNICLLLLKNRRSRLYGILDGNALSIKHFQGLDSSIREEELEELVTLGILKKTQHYFQICGNTDNLSENEKFLLSFTKGDNLIYVDELKLEKEFRKRKIGISKTLQNLEQRGVVKCVEMRYDFKNTKISTGLNGINRIFLPSSNIYPTLVASDTNDYVSTVAIEGHSIKEWREQFMTKVYQAGKYRQITKSEACRIQGFPADFILPQARTRWMKLIGNSVAVPVIRTIAQAIVETGVFDKNN